MTMILLLIELFSLDTIIFFINFNAIDPKLYRFLFVLCRNSEYFYSHRPHLNNNVLLNHQDYDIPVPV